MSSSLNHTALAHLYDACIDSPSMELGRDFPESEYKLRLKKTRELMSMHGIDALVVTTSTNGSYFTSKDRPHEWHNLCQTRAAFYILTIDNDYLYMTPGLGGEHLNSARRRTWVTNIRSVLERFRDNDRIELWSIEYMVESFKELGLSKARLGWELGDCQTLGMSYNDFNEFRRRMPDGQFLDASPILRKLHQIPTPLQIDRIRKACVAAVKMHEQVVDIVRVGMTEREFAKKMDERFEQLRFDEGYIYHMFGYHDVRNPRHPEMNLISKTKLTDRPFFDGDVFNRNTSGMSYLGQDADIDRTFYVGRSPPANVAKWYRVASKCNEAMAETLKPGVRCSEVFEAENKVTKENGLPVRLVGRNGHWANPSGLSIHPDVKIMLEPGMVISTEPTLIEDFGYIDIEDIYLITANGCERLHSMAPSEIPCCGN
ncbi:MAG TPA: Xaa-Pro peptidase family protein [Candidatus Bathyarchaeia archaeon]|nr:Xaa-Pro peptidase family protein [Candidatus Bathyarchaeia archaeon]